MPMTIKLLTLESDKAPTGHQITKTFPKTKYLKTIASPCESVDVNAILQITTCTLYDSNK